MVKNYLNILIRGLKRKSIYTIVNILGLSLGITGAIIIYSIIDFELGFDSYHNDLDKIYRISTKENRFGKERFTPGTAFQLAPALREESTIYEEIVTVNFNFIDPIISIYDGEGNKPSRYEESSAVYVEREYFQLFKYEWLMGDPSTALADESNIVITKDIAIKFFGETDVLDREIILNDSIFTKVSGVLENPPLNTDMPFNIFMVFGEKARSAYSHWSWTSTSSSVQTFVKVKDGADIKKAGEDITTLFRKNIDEDRPEGISEEFFLLPLSKLHTDDRFDYNFGSVFSLKGIYALGLIGIFLILTACINFINLNTVQALKRSKEVGIRKTMGASRGQIIVAQLMETGFLVLVSLLISFGIGEVAFIYIDDLVGKPMGLDIFSNGKIMLFSGVLLVVVTIIAGLYPAWMSSKFKPAETLKFSLNSRTGNSLVIRKSLVIVQFVISQTLIIGTIIVYQQMNYFMTVPMGFDKDAIVEVPLPQREEEAFRFLSEIRRKPEVKNVTFSNTSAISQNTWFGNFDLFIGEEILQENAQVKFIDKNYFDTYSIDFVEGGVTADSTYEYFVNETLLNKVGVKEYEKAIGNKISFWGYKAEIAGVVKDHNTVSLHKQIEPVVYIPELNYNVIGIKLATSNFQSALSTIEQVWEESFPKDVYSYEFLDEKIAGFYESERRASRLILLFAIMAIVIGSIGLFGLVSFLVDQKTKEIGIRKALGAEIRQVLSLFMKEFITLIIIAFVISVPLVYFMMQEWLNGFIYRIEPGLEIFIAGLLVSLIAALVTVGYQSYKAAIINPVETLRSE